MGNDELIAKIATDYELSAEQKDELEGSTIHFHQYAGGCYCGSAITVWEKDGHLFEAHGAHCSCYGLEDQWSPEATSWEALALRDWMDWDNFSDNYEWDKDGCEAFIALVKSKAAQ